MSFTESLTSLCSNVFHITGPHFRWLFSIENSGAVLELDDPPWTLAQLAGDCSVTDSKILSGKFQPISLQFIPGFWCQVIWLAEKRFVLPRVFAASCVKLRWLGRLRLSALSEGSQELFCPQVKLQPSSLLPLLSSDWITITAGVPTKTRQGSLHSTNYEEIREFSQLIATDSQPTTTQWGGKQPETRQWGHSQSCVRIIRDNLWRVSD